MSTVRSPTYRNPESGTGYHGLSSVQRKFTNLVLQRRTSSGFGATEKTRQGLTLLHSPPEPLIDLVFVHGFGGGSFKTWRKYEEAFSLWPKAWIALDGSLSHVRTFTFGYPSDWAERKESVLNVHDFGRKLLGDLTTSPLLRRDNANPIILIGHSMGGLVTKKAYLLARQENRQIASRIKYMFFFATPHRGSDSADLLNKILGATSLDKPYLSDLVRNSPSLQVINDEFKNYAEDVGLWSFYETLKTNFVVKNEIIVERDSAVMGYKHEESQFLNADHRGVCKFESPEDPNYITVRNALVAVTDDLLSNVVQDKEDEKWQQIKSIQSYLNVFEPPESDLEERLEFKTMGSCRWIEDRKGFLKWRDVGANESQAVPQKFGLKYDREDSRSVGSCQVYWLTAKPGSGKSVCAAHVITHLHELGFDCSYFFFRLGIKTKQVLGALFRSLAYQMALLHLNIRQMLQSMQNAGNTFDMDDEGTIWRKMFTNGILKAKLERPQFWIIDALDECRFSEKLFPFLAKLECAFNLRIFITSRPTPELERLFSRLKLPTMIDRIRPVDTESDIRLYLSSDEEDLPIDDAQARAALVDELLARSTGCFLWVRLVRRELDDAYSAEIIASVLQDIPEEMSELYKRSLQAMSTSREKRLIQGLLMWTTCSIRPLTLAELQAALKYDLGLQVRDLRRSIEGLCGNLLYVDPSDRIQMIHSTARDFLLNQDDSDFAVKREDGNERLAKACLRFLEEEMRPPRSRSLGSIASKRNSELPVFSEYASTAFAEHVSGATSASDSLLVALTKFLNVNVLAWIEYVASEKRDLYTLTRAAKSFQNYLKRRAKYGISPLGAEVQTIEHWSIDLIRLVAKFGRNLVNYPNSIFFLIPPIAPPDSKLYQQALNSPRWLEVVGPAASAWDDCISVLEYKDTWATALACGDTTFATGMKSGRIILYDQSTCLEKVSIQHQQATDITFTSKGSNTRRQTPVKLLAFDTSSERLASASLCSICVWTLSGELLHSVALQEPCVALAFVLEKDELMAVSRSSQVVRWRLGNTENDEDGLFPPEAIARRLSRGNIDPSVGKIPRQAPLAATISPDQTMLALLYRGQPVYLWSLQDDTLLGLCRRDPQSEASTGFSVLTALFNPNIDIQPGLLAVTHQDGTLVLYDAWAQKEVNAVEGDAYTLASTPDGRTLASGDTQGTIKLWDFETLTLMYCIKSGLDGIKSLAFSGDGHRLMDRRDAKTKIWEPNVLIRRSVEEDASISDAVTLDAGVFGVNEDAVEITAMTCDASGHYILAGQSNGSIVAYETNSGHMLSTLYRHGGDLFITAITYHKGIIASADAGGRVLAWKLLTDQSLTLSVYPICDQRLPDSVHQLLVSSNGDQLLVTTASTDTLWPLSSGTGATKRSISASVTTKCSKWENEMSSMRRWLHVGGNVATLCQTQLCLYDWETFTEVERFQLEEDSATVAIPGPTVIQDLVTDEAKEHVIASFCRYAGDRSGTEILFWINPFQQDRESRGSVVYPGPVLHLPGKHVKTFLGVHSNRVIYLDHELWVCSIDLCDISSNSFGDLKRHFFISPDFVGNQNNASAMVNSLGYIIFAKESRLAVIKGGLDWSY